jgi:predicted NAD/FAD-dependent oxidoreductase
VDGNWSIFVDAAVIASGAPSAAILMGKLGKEALATSLMAFDYEPITTCYLQYAATTTLALPFYALVDEPAAGHWGQFVFDRGQLDAARAGSLSVVVSASSEAAALDRRVLGAAVATQLALVFKRPDLAQPVWTQVISEKRATFACTPGLQRPGNDVGLAGLAIAGDYTASDYPATLESAVRSGVTAASLVRAL